MTTHFEEQVYEQTALWEPSRFLSDLEQLKRFEVLEGLLSAYPVQSLLDVGTGNGVFLRYLEEKKKIPLLTGIERSRTAIELAACHSEIIHGEADELPFGDLSFDGVSALEVIEHFPFQVYEKALAEIQRVAKHLIFLSVPYREDRPLTECPYCGCIFNAAYHVRTFDEQTLERLFHHFRCIEMQKIFVKKQVALLPIWIIKKIIRKRAPFSQYALCPLCGYKLNPTETSESGAASQPFLNRLRTKLYPWIHYPRWIACVYVRR